MKSVIHIYGASGASTTTLGRALCAELGFRHMDTEDYYWLHVDPPITIKRDPIERVAMMQSDINAAENVVISGSLTKWGDVLIPQFTQAIRMYTPTEVRLRRLHAREYARFGARIDVGGDMYEAYQAFLEWASKYDTADETMRSLREHDEWQKKLQCPRIVLDGTRPIVELLHCVKQALQ